MKLPAFPVFGKVARFYGDTLGSCRVCERSNWGTEEKRLLCGWSRVESDIPPNLRGWAPRFVPGDVFTARWVWLVACPLVAGGGAVRSFPVGFRTLSGRLGSARNVVLLALQADWWRGLEQDGLGAQPPRWRRSCGAPRVFQLRLGDWASTWEALGSAGWEHGGAWNGPGQGAGG